MSNKSPQELREQVRDRFAGLTGTYDGADAMADFTIDLLHSHMQAAFDDVIGEDSHTINMLLSPDNPWEGNNLAENNLRQEQRKRAAKWLRGDK